MLDRSAVNSFATGSTSAGDSGMDSEYRFIEDKYKWDGGIDSFSRALHNDDATNPVLCGAKSRDWNQDSLCWPRHQMLSYADVAICSPLFGGFPSPFDPSFKKTASKGFSAFSGWTVPKNNNHCLLSHSPKNCKPSGDEMNIYPCHWNRNTAQTRSFPGWSANSTPNIIWIKTPFSTQRKFQYKKHVGLVNLAAS